jgi:hypothetical protein
MRSYTFVLRCVASSYWRLQRPTLDQRFNASHQAMKSLRSFNLFLILQWALVTAGGKSCRSVSSDVRRGPHEVILNLTQPEVYDDSKRPNLAYNPQTHNVKDKPDVVYVSILLQSIVSINQITQQIVSRYYLKYESFCT